MSIKNLPPQFDTILDDGEKILWRGKPQFFPFIMSGIPFLIIGLLWGAFDIFFITMMPDEMSGFAIPFFAIHMFPFYGSILNMLRLVLVFKNTEYAITDKRLIVRTGFWGIDFRSLDFSTISDVEVNVNPVENMYSVGTIRIYSTNIIRRGRRGYNRFVGIQNPYEVYKKIKEISVDVKTDWNYPNALRPGTNPGYQTEFNPKRKNR
ncbi:MAG: PH domain-containing protein [Melioribacteraceae bacterium]|nr:PH domain-containing protein [Melioribacteraceae bacterium]